MILTKQTTLLTTKSDRNQQNKVGMKDELVDKDDFPRNDIDVWAVRQARNSIRKLETDAKDILNRMQTKLEELHSLSKPTST